jgi:hypothetical protein
MKTKTEVVQVKLSERELEKWQSQAREHQCPLSEWIRRRCRGPGRLRPARKPVEPRCEHDIPESQWPCPACDAIIEANLMRRQRRPNASRNRSNGQGPNVSAGKRLNG